MLSELFARQMTKTKVSRMCYRPNLEALEDRVVPSTDTWTGAGGTINWSNTANWDTGHAPQNGDDLYINTSQVLTNDQTPGMIFHNITLVSCGIQGDAIVLTGDMTAPSNTATMNLNSITLGASVQFVGALNVYSPVNSNGFNLTLAPTFSTRAAAISRPPVSSHSFIFPPPPPPPPPPVVVTGGVMFGAIQLSGTLSFSYWQVRGPITLTSSSQINLSAGDGHSFITGGVNVNGFDLTLTGNGDLFSCPINGPGTTTIAGNVESFSVISTPVNVISGGIFGGVGSGTVTGPLTFAPGSKYLAAITSATSNSQVQVNGPIDLGGADLGAVGPNDPNLTFPPHSAFVILQSSGAITSTFNGLPDGALVFFYKGPWGIHYLPGQVVLSNDRDWRDVMTGDFNGDGKQDIAGRDLSGDWWVSLSTGSAFDVPQAWTAWSRTTWLDVHTGDFNGDGKTDIAGRASVNGQWWVALSTGSGFNDYLWETWSTFATWVDVKVGDFNGDGKADIAGRYLQGGTWWVGLSNGSAFSTTQWATWSTGGTWVDVNVGDFNGDGTSDIGGRALENGRWYVGLSNGSTGFNTTLWDTWSTGATWVNVQVGDFNGDGKADITGRYLEGGSWWTAISNGSKFTTTSWDTWSTAATWVDIRLGDFNGDGKADLTGRYFEGGSWWTAISTGSSFTTTKWDTWSASANWVDVLAADFTGTGMASITGRYLEGGSWWTGVSSGTSFNTTLWTTWPA